MLSDAALLEIRLVGIIFRSKKVRLVQQGIHKSRRWFRSSGPSMRASVTFTSSCLGGCRSSSHRIRLQGTGGRKQWRRIRQPLRQESKAFSEMPRGAPLMFYISCASSHSLSGWLGKHDFGVPTYRVGETMKKEVEFTPYFLPWFLGVETLKTGAGEISKLICGLPWKYKRSTCTGENYVPFFFFLAHEYLGSLIQGTGRERELRCVFFGRVLIFPPLSFKWQPALFS